MERHNDLRVMPWPYVRWLLSVMYSRRLLLGGSRLLNGLHFKRPDRAKLVSIFGTVVGDFFYFFSPGDIDLLSVLSFPFRWYLD